MHNPLGPKGTGPPSLPPRHTPTAAPAKAMRVVRAKDMKAAALEFYERGYGNGETTHMDYLNYFWSWMKKEITIITGYPNHGKSEWVFALMLVKAAIKDWKFALFVPENESDVFITLAQMLVGRTANVKDINNRMSWAELDRALDWLNEHFWLVEAPEGCTPKQLLAEFSRLNAEVNFDGVMLDPWNQLSHDFQSREDLYLSEQFSALKRFAIKENVAVLVTAHPAGAVKDKNGLLVRPDAYSISGGKMWNNKFDNVIAVFRPDFPRPETEIWVHKIKKQGRVGHPGTVFLTYSRDLFRYSPQAPTGKPHPLETVSFNAPADKPKETGPGDWPSQQISANSTFEQDGPQPTPEPPQLKPPTLLGGTVRTRRDLDDDFEAYAQANTPPA